MFDITVDDHRHPTTPADRGGDNDTANVHPHAIVRAGGTNPAPIRGATGDGGDSPCASLGVHLRDQAGSVATEYGLLAVVAATIVAVVLEWATSGGISGLLDSVLARVSTLVGL